MMTKFEQAVVAQVLANALSSGAAGESALIAGSEKLESLREAARNSRVHGRIPAPLAVKDIVAAVTTRPVGERT